MGGKPTEQCLLEPSPTPPYLTLWYYEEGYDLEQAFRRRSTPELLQSAGSAPWLRNASAKLE